MDDDELARYLADVASAPILSLAEERELATRAAAGDGLAASRLLQSNLRLVVALARRYTGTGVALLDLIQEGNLALVDAVERFDPARGFAFRSFATWHIRRAIGKVASAPDLDAGLARLQEAWDSFVAREARQPSLRELAAAVGLPEDEVTDLLGLPPG